MKDFLIDWMKTKKNLLISILSVFLIFFFSVVLINAIDMNSIKMHLNKLLSDNGEWGIIVFIFVFIVSYSSTVPSTVLGATTGVLFGFLTGSIYYIIICFLSSLLVFSIVKYLIRDKVQRKISKNKRLTDLQKLIESEGFRFLFFVRYIPIHVTFINALFGISKVKPRDFIITCFFLLPEWILHVYIGYVAYRTADIVQQGMSVGDVLQIISLIISISAVVYIGWIAQKVVKQSGVKIKENNFAVSKQTK